MVTAFRRLRPKVPVRNLQAGADPPPLYNGDRLTQREFHRRYEAYPKDVKFELIGGTVYMASPLGRQHGIYHPELSVVFLLYKAATPGVELLDNATTILGDESEPQPDLTLRVLPEWGGQSRTTKDNYVKGPPEALAEIAHSSKALDLHQKRDDYERAGVLEYIVWCVAEKELRWFNFKTDQEIQPDAMGIYRSRVFPGLWIDSRALAEHDSARLIEVAQQGIASAEHAAFVKKLTAARRKRK
jgi:hypothetical protein